MSKTRGGPGQGNYLKKQNQQFFYQRRNKLPANKLDISKDIQKTPLITLLIVLDKTLKGIQVVCD